MTATPARPRPAVAVSANAGRTIWVVSELYYPEETSTGYFVTGIAEALAEDYAVGAICAQPTYASRGVLAPRTEVRNGVRIERCRSTRLDKDVLLYRVFNLATSSLAMAWTAARRLRRDDVVLVVTNPPVLPFLILAAARLRRARVVLLTHDVYPEVLVATGFARPGSVPVVVVAALSRWLYRHVARIVVIGRDMAGLVGLKVSAAQRHRVAIIPNWGDVELVRPLPKEQNALRQRLGLTEKFVVQYMGNIGRTHGIETVLEAAMLMRAQEDVHFLFVGWGSRRSWLERAVRESGLPNVTVLDSCPREQLAEYLNACDLSVIAFLPGMAGVSVPSRMYNVMAAGTPILAVADRESELALVVGEERIGWVVPPGEADAVASAIGDARRDADRLGAMGARARAVAEAKYSKDVIARSYRDLFRRLT